MTAVIVTDVLCTIAAFVVGFSMVFRAVTGKWWWQ